MLDYSILSMIVKGHLGRHKLKHKVRVGAECLARQIFAAKNNAIPGHNQAIVRLRFDLYLCCVCHSEISRKTKKAPQKSEDSHGALCALKWYGGGLAALLI